MAEEIKKRLCDWMKWQRRRLRAKEKPPYSDGLRSSSINSLTLAYSSSVI
jgi:hypothetical protein